MGTKPEPKARTDVESNEHQKLPYPKRVFFIIANELCERLNFLAMCTVLTLFLKNKLEYSENDATVAYHGFAMAIYFICIFGGIVSDVWLGKFKTILYLSIIYAVGCTVVATSSIPDISLPPRVILIVGLVLIAIGSGGIKPNVAAFGGDQFKLPEQAAHVEAYFSMYYFVICLGALISTTVTPILRQDVHCFGDNDCFPLALGTPAILMLISIAFFLVGKSSYTYKEISSENMILQVAKCTMNAIATKYREGRKSPRKNLLDYSIETYGEKLVKESRGLLRLLVLYLPVPFFYALHDQRGSRWTFQANKMNGDIGFYTIKPDQIQVLNPLLVLTCIPFFRIVIYPILRKIGIRRPLQKMVIGGMLASLSFLFSTLVQLRIESSPENSVNMLWLVPQYIAMSAGELMFAITGTGFSYEQAPERMQSVVMALWISTAGFGNLILLSVAQFIKFESQSHEFLLFCVLMFIDMLVFMILAYNYKSSTQNESDWKDKEHLEQYVPLKVPDENV